MSISYAKGKEGIEMSAPEIDHNKLPKLLEVHYKTKHPVLIWGAPGIGKTQAITAFAKSKAKDENKDFVEWNQLSRTEKHRIAIEGDEKKFILASTRSSDKDPTDLKGALNFFNNKEFLDWELPLVCKAFCNKKNSGVWFFDEFTQAPPLIQNVMQQVLLDRVINEEPLSKEAFIIAATNRVEDFASVFELPSPVANRFHHYILEAPNTETWTKWGVKHGIDSTVIGYLNFKQSHLFMPPKEGQNITAWASPRTWEFASDTIKEAKSMPSSDIVSLIGSAVGIGVATEYSGFVKTAINIDIDGIIKDPKTISKYIKDPAKDIDKKYAIVAGIVERYANNKKILKSVLDIAMEFHKLGKKPGDQPEFVILLLKQVKEIDTNDFINVINHKAWGEINKHYGQYMQD